MKYSAALAACVAPLAMAKAVRNTYPVRRDPQSFGVTFPGMAGFGVTETSLTEVILIWANPGGGAPTQILNQQATVTQTVTVPAGGVPTVVPGVAGGSQTIPAGASAVVPGAAATHPVTVGGPGGLIFQPDNIKANIGDMVVFTFLGNNHTATQSAFDIPCSPLAGGMDSGFMSNPNSTTIPAPQVAMQVMVPDPLWFFCAQNNHCGKGMTFSINASPERTHAMFQQMAIAQAGNGAQSFITGGAGAAAAPAAAPAAPAAAPVDPALQPLPLPADPAATAASLQPLPAGNLDPAASLAPLPGAVGTQPIGAVGAVGANGQGIVTGTGTLNPDGSCSCSVSCGAGAFPNIAEQGVNAFGGMAGALPIEMASPVTPV